MVGPSNGAAREGSQPKGGPGNSLPSSLSLPLVSRAHMLSQDRRWVIRVGPNHWALAFSLVPPSVARIFIWQSLFIILLKLD